MRKGTGQGPRGIKVALGAEVVSGPWTGGRMSVLSFWFLFSFVIWAVSSQGNDKHSAGVERWRLGGLAMLRIRAAEWGYEQGVALAGEQETQHVLWPWAEERSHRLPKYVSRVRGCLCRSEENTAGQADWTPAVQLTSDLSVAWLHWLLLGRWKTWKEAVSEGCCPACHYAVLCLFPWEEKPCVFEALFRRLSTCGDWLQ